MAAINSFAQDAVDRAEPLTVAAAYAQCRAAALAESVIAPSAWRSSHIWSTSTTSLTPFAGSVEAIAAVAGRVPPGSAVTVEPGGQIELSGPPEAGVGPAAVW
jgi:gamma-glutamylcysteine synthetase